MSFRPSLKTTSQAVSAEASFLASDHQMAKRSGITLDASTVEADDDGNKILTAGTVLAKVDDTGKYRTYENTLDADEGGVAAGFLYESVNLKDGDVICGMLIHGSVLEARCSGLDSNAKTDLAGRIVFQ
jgi:hypothetical protein